MKKWVVERNEQLRKTTTWEVTAESKEEAMEMVYEQEIKPKRVFEKKIDSDTDAWPAEGK